MRKEVTFQYKVIPCLQVPLLTIIMWCEMLLSVPNDEHSNSDYSIMMIVHVNTGFRISTLFIFMMAKLKYNEYIYIFLALNTNIFLPTFSVL
jgi:hypothetical protein